MTILEKPHWTVDRRVPVALLFSFALMLAGQTFAVGWWMSRLSSTVETTVKTVEEVRNDLDVIDRRITQTDTLAARFDEKLSAFDRQIQRMARILDQINSSHYDGE